MLDTLFSASQGAANAFVYGLTPIVTQRVAYTTHRLFALHLCLRPRSWIASAKHAACRASRGLAMTPTSVVPRWPRTTVRAIIPHTRDPLCPLWVRVR